jgi:hypothetical protein
MLLRPPPRFPGLAREAFEVFSVPDREERRRAILAAFHPALTLLAGDVLAALDPAESAGFHVHLPQLNWPKGYVPFCTWVTLSRHSQGYQTGPQLGVAVHADHVAARLGWDTAADAFGRFEFRCLYGGLDRELLAAARAAELQFRVHAAVPWPIGSRVVFESATDLPGSFQEARRRGVFWELGRRWDVPDAVDRVAEPAWSEEVRDVLLALLPLYDRSD